MATIRTDEIVDAAGTGGPDFPNGATFNGQTEATDTVLGLVKKSKSQTKYMTTDDTLSQLNFNNLVTGRVYRVDLWALCSQSNNQFEITITHNSTQVGGTYFHNATADSSKHTVSTVVYFTAAASTVTFATVGGGGTKVLALLPQSSTALATGATLTEFADTVITTDFT